MQNLPETPGGTQPGNLPDPKAILDSEPGESPKANKHQKHHTQLTLGQGGLVFITVHDGAATTLVSWCLNLGHTVFQGPLRTSQRGSTTNSPILQVTTLRA